MKPVAGLLSVLALLASAGCVTSHVEQIRTGALTSGITGGEAVVVLARRQYGTQFTESGFAQCVAESLADLGMEVYPRRRFRDRLFPWFEPRAAPVSAEQLHRLLRKPAIAKRLRATGVAYLVWLDGNTRDGDGGGGMSCAVSPAGGGCLGFTWWQEHAEYQAYIWDLRARRAVGRITVDASGTSYMPAVIIPIPLLARTRAAACDDLADQIGTMLRQR